MIIVIIVLLILAVDVAMDDATVVHIRQRTAQLEGPLTAQPGRNIGAVGLVLYETPVNVSVAYKN